MKKTYEWCDTEWHLAALIACGIAGGCLGVLICKLRDQLTEAYCAGYEDGQDQRRERQPAAEASATEDLEGTQSAGEQPGTDRPAGGEGDAGRNGDGHKPDGRDLSTGPAADPAD